MNPLPRLLGLALVVVLATLTALLAAAAWRTPPAEAPAGRAAAAETVGQAAVPAPPPAARLAAALPRMALICAMLALALAAALVFSLTLRPARVLDAQSPYDATRTEVTALARLAESSAAQGAELTRERDVRRRAEEDAQLKQRLLAQSVDEKIRLGRDLHDGIIQSLYAVGLTLESLRALVKSNPAAAEQRLEETRAALNAAIRDVRAYITGLAPENLRRAGFGQALAALLDELRAGRTVELNLEVDDEASALLTSEQSVEALQIAREAVSNALRHGGASRVTLRVHKGEGEVGLLVQDDGSGFEADTSHERGHGLGNMRARAENIGARLRVISQPQEGTRVVLTVPVLHPV